MTVLRAGATLSCAELYRKSEGVTSHPRSGRRQRIWSRECQYFSPRHVFWWRC